MYQNLRYSQVGTEDDGKSSSRSYSDRNSYVWSNNKNSNEVESDGRIKQTYSPRIIGSNRINLEEYDKIVDEKGRVVYKKKESYSNSKFNNSISNNNSLSNRSIASNSNPHYISKISQISKQSDDRPDDTYNIRASNIYGSRTYIRK